MKINSGFKRSQTNKIGIKLPTQNLAQLLTFLLAIIPAILTGVLIIKYSVNVPYWDQWDLARMFEKIYAGNLTFQDLIAQHNESRKFFPRLLFIGMAYLTGWDVRYEMLAILILACLVSFNIYRLSLLTVGGSRLKLLWLACLSNLLIFSPIQWENWLFGIQVVAIAPIACITLCIIAAYSNIDLKDKILLGIVLSTISTFSYANGLLCWVVVFPVIALAKPNAWKELLKQKWLMLAWVVGFTSNAVLYFHDYKKPPYHPSFSDGLTHPIKALHYFLAYLGATLAQNSLTVATMVGTVLILTFLGVGLYLVIFNHQNNLINRTIGWLSIAGYSLISAAITTSGRVGFGVEQSLSSRYTTFSLYLTVSLIYLTAIILEDAGIRKIVSQPSLNVNRIVSSVLTIAIFLHSITAAYGIEKMQKKQIVLDQGKVCLLLINVVKDDDCLKTIHPEPELIKSRAKILNEMGFLNPKLVSGNIETFQGKEAYDLNHGWLDSIKQASQEQYIINGWAVLPKKRKPADAVILTYEDRQGKAIAFAIAAPQKTRKDVAKNLNTPEYLKSGWEKLIAIEQIPKGSKIKAWAFDADTGKAFELNGIVNL